MLLGNSNTIIDNLYYLFWLNKESGLKDNIFAMKIPDTVIFNGNSIIIWYYSNKDGVIKMHKHQKYNVETIYQHFIKKQTSSGIVGYIVNEPDSDD